MIIGLLLLVFGEKKLKVKEGVVLKMFSVSTLNAKIIWWAMGVMCSWFGATLSFCGGEL